MRSNQHHASVGWNKVVEILHAGLRGPDECVAFAGDCAGAPTTVAAS